MLSSGFSNAPISKYAILYLIAASIAASIADVKYMFYILVVPHLWGYMQIWRIAAWQACYLNSTEVLFGAMLLYHFRVIERLWGSRKFASFLLATLPYTSILPPLLLSLLVRPLSLNNINYLPAGPTAIIFSILAQYHAAIPHTFMFRISTHSSSNTSSNTTASNNNNNNTNNNTTPPSILLSDKSTTYLLALQLSLSQFPHSILPALTGWVIGYAYRAELLPGRAFNWRVPGWVYGDRDVDKRRSGRSGAAGREGESAGGESTARDSEHFEGLRRRLEGESRAAAAARGQESGNGGGVEDGREGGQQTRRPLAGQILDRFRGTF